MKVPTWEEAMEEAEQRVSKKYTMIPVENSPSQGELEKYARELISRREDFNKHQAKIFEGQELLRVFVDGLPLEKQNLMYDYLRDVMDNEFVDKMMAGERLD